MKWYSVFMVSLGAALVGCGSGGASSLVNFNIDIEVPLQIELPAPTVTNPPQDTGNPVLRAQNFDLASVGYVEQEYFLEGSARSFTNVNEFLNDGLWEAEPAGSAPYKIRIVVHKPADPETSLSGGIVVEWMNASNGFDLPVCWGLGHVEMYRNNYVWVGVSAQAASIEGGPLSLKSVNPERYASLSHPGDSFSYDIFAQVSSALGNTEGLDILDGKMRGSREACGHGEAADRLVTFTNAVLPLYLPQVFPELMIVGRSGGAAPLSQLPQADIPAPDAPQIRSDSQTLVLNLQSETDVTLRGSAASRQEDSPAFRLWEVAGTAHLDYYSTDVGRDDATGEPRFSAIVEADTIDDLLQCDQPVNSGPMHYAFNRALAAISTWRGGAPRAPDRLQLDEQGNLILDSNGNVLGGLRTPYVDAPAATLSGLGNNGSAGCELLGTTALFTADRMASLYVDEDGYVQSVRESANRAVADDFLLRRDADAIIEWAPSQWQSQVGQ